MTADEPESAGAITVIVKDLSPATNEETLGAPGTRGTTFPAVAGATETEINSAVARTNWPSLEKNFFGWLLIILFSFFLGLTEV